MRKPGQHVFRAVGNAGADSFGKAICVVDMTTHQLHILADGRYCIQRRIGKRLGNSMVDNLPVQHGSG